MGTKNPKKDHRILKRGFIKLQNLLKASNAASTMLQAELRASQERVATLTSEVRAATDRADTAEAGIEAARTVSRSPQAVSDRA